MQFAPPLKNQLPLRMSEPILQQEQLPILTSSAVKESLAPQDRPSTHSPPSQSAHNSDSDHTHLDSEDESLLETSTTGNEVAQLLRKTVEELELALEVSMYSAVRIYMRRLHNYSGLT